MKPSEITFVKLRGGFKGPHIDVQLLIESKVKLDILDFSMKESCVRDCENFCYMQIRIQGRLAVTWQSSGVLTQYLQDCRLAQEEQGMEVFPISDCVIVQGEDRCYTLMDSDSSSLECDEHIFYDLVDQSKRHRRRH